MRRSLKNRSSVEHGRDGGAREDARVGRARQRGAQGGRSAAAAGQGARRKVRRRGAAAGASQPVESIWDVELGGASNFKRRTAAGSSQVASSSCRATASSSSSPTTRWSPTTAASCWRCTLTSTTPTCGSSPRLGRGQADHRRARRGSTPPSRGSTRAKPPIATTLAAVPSVLVMNLVRGRSLKGVALAGYMDRTEADKFCETMLGPPGALSDRRPRAAPRDRPDDGLRHIHLQLRSAAVRLRQRRQHREHHAVRRRRGDRDRLDDLVLRRDGVGRGARAVRPLPRSCRRPRRRVRRETRRAAPRLRRRAHAAAQGTRRRADEAFCPPLHRDIGDDGVRACRPASSNRSPSSTRCRAARSPRCPPPSCASSASTRARAPSASGPTSWARCSTSSPSEARAWRRRRRAARRATSDLEIVRSGERELTIRHGLRRRARRL